MVGKIIALVLVLVVVAWILTGQTESTYSSFKSVGVSEHTTEAEPVVETEHSSAKIHMTQKSMHHAIKAAGEENGWIMTEYKANTIIAEKLSDNDTVSVTVTFDNISFLIEPANTGLNSAISAALH